jgi:hypothetical protein
LPDLGYSHTLLIQTESLIVNNFEDSTEKMARIAMKPRVAILSRPMAEATRNHKTNRNEPHPKSVAGH